MAIITNSPKPKEDPIKAKVRALRGKLPVFCEKILKVQTMEGQIVPFVLNGPQLILHKIVEMIRAEGRPVRIIALKARRMGFSTYFSARFYQKTSYFPNQYAAQITHEPEATDTLFKMIKRFYNLSPERLRPETVYNNTRLLEFNKPDGRGLNSAFRVATAAKDDYGSGQLIHFCHFCLHPDTPVLLANGVERKVKDVAVGETLITHNGNVGTITAISRKHAAELPDGNRMIVIHPWLGSPITMTPQHKVWTNMGWVPAGELDPHWHMVSMPIRKITDRIRSLPISGRKSKFGPAYNGPSEFPLDRETGFAIGYYLAEGCLTKTNVMGAAATYHRIIFTLHDKEHGFAERACSALMPFCKRQPSIKDRKGTKTTTYTINNSVLADFVYENFGSMGEKRIPDWVFDCGEEFCRGIVLGYLAGDGSKGIGGASQNYDSNSISATSIRESITYQIRDIVASLGYGWGRVNSKPGGVFYGRNCRPAWIVYFNGECARRLREDIGIPFSNTAYKADRAQRYRMDLNNGMVWIKIKKITHSECDEVFDLEIDHQDHSFRTPHFSVSNSEVSKWPADTMQSLLTSILQCVPDIPSSEVVFESTAKGIGGEFYDRFWGARYRVWISKLDAKGKPVIETVVNEDAPAENQYTSIFLPWFVFERYQEEPPKDFKLVEDKHDRALCEVTIQKKYGLSLAQMYWRRNTLVNKCNNDINMLNQEYPACPSDAFIGTGSTVFDVVKLAKIKDTMPHPAARYDALTGLGQWISKPEGKLRVWKEPIRGRAYIIGADVAEGLSKGDFSCADVIDHVTGEQVAQWHGHVDADQFGMIVCMLAKRYNEAFVAIERNNHGLTTLTVLTNMDYPNLYAEMVPDPPGKPRKRYGWLTGRATKPLIIDNLVMELREDQHGINCRETIEEMMTYKRDDAGRTDAEEGRFDDRVMSLAIAKHVRQTTPLPSQKKVPDHYKIRNKKRASRISASAWT